MLAATGGAQRWRRAAMAGRAARAEVPGVVVASSAIRPRWCEDAWPAAVGLRPADVLLSALVGAHLTSPVGPPGLRPPRWRNGPSRR